jgi:hypothetical protein
MLGTVTATSVSLARLLPEVSAAGSGRRTPDGRPFYFVQLVDQLERLQLERLQLDRDGCTVSW